MAVLHTMKSAESGVLFSEAHLDDDPIEILPLATTHHQWSFQEPKLEVPTIYNAFFQGYVREYPHKIWPDMVQYLHFRNCIIPIDTMTFANNLPRL